MPQRQACGLRWDAVAQTLDAHPHVGDGARAALWGRTRRCGAVRGAARPYSALARPGHGERFQAIDQRPPRDTEELRGPCLIAPTGVQCAGDPFTLGGRL